MQHTVGRKVSDRGGVQISCAISWRANDYHSRLSDAREQPSIIGTHCGEPIALRFCSALNTSSPLALQMCARLKECAIRSCLTILQ